MSTYEPLDPSELVPQPSVTPTVAIAGASGFVGRALASVLAPTHHVIGLGRKAPAELPDAVWRRCDLFSLLDAERGLHGAEVAVYLVHSMMPTSRLTQGRFQDLDLICADNFGRAAARQGVRRIVYLGGMVPPGEVLNLSDHLRSRLEVEGALAAHGVPLVALRASLVIGAGGSSFEMMVRLVERLPAMILPSWTRSRTQPIALDDVVRLLAFAVDDDELPAGNYDVGGPDVVSYRELMTMTAHELGLRRPMVSVPLFSPGLSRAWISLFTRAPRALVAPLVQSLRHPMVARDRRLQERAGIPGAPLFEALAHALVERTRRQAAARTASRIHAVPPLTASPPALAALSSTDLKFDPSRDPSRDASRPNLSDVPLAATPHPSDAALRAVQDAVDEAVHATALGAAPAVAAREAAPFVTVPPADDEPNPSRRKKMTKPAGDVRSVQRLELPTGHDARWIADEYLRWLPHHLRFLLKVDVTRATGEGRPAPVLARLRVRFVRRPLLELRFSPERSTLDRPLFYVTGGVLARRAPSHGRLEFREVSDGRTVLAALHDYVPRLPFGIYLATQGLIHRLVMAAFARHLRRLAREARA